MSRIVSKFVGAVVTFVAIGTLVSGCIEAEGRIFIETIYPLNDEGVCTTEPEVITSRGCAVCDSSGCYEDLHCGGICMLVRNQMQSSLDNPSNNNNVETSVVVLHSYDLRYISDGVDLSSADTTVQITVPAQPDETSQPVYISFLSSDAADIISSTAPVGTLDLIVGVRFYGRTTGGLEVETPETFVGVTVAKF
ncbi:MAG: hypothetical protein JNK04_20790 [Myxococcales bacterium]|nr:hypothetical protein [Myxococcales bacterium]